MDLEEVRSKINPDYFRSSPPSNSKYLPFMPIKDFSNFVSLEEGATPLIKSRRLGQQLGVELYFKLESENPTGAFKDRGSAVELTIAREFGAKAISVASTGNMAASCSCYAAAAKIPCFVFVPEDTPISKLAQAIAYGGKIVQVKGSYNDAARLAEEVALELGFYLAGDYAFRVEGQKTAAFEVVDQLFFQTPEAVICPIGCGTNLTAYGKGFEEYHKLGFIDRVPELIGVQAQGAASVVQAFKENKKTVEPYPNVDTIASAIAISYPLDGQKALEAIYQTNGQALATSDREMLEAQYLLSKEEGIFVEASCASSLAALKKLVEDGKYKGKKVVCVLTGAGLKDPSTIIKIALKPATIYPELGEFISRYESDFFEGNSVSFFDEEEPIFSETPDEDAIQNALLKFFGVSYSQEYIAQIRDMSERFIKKGKSISFSDFQDIVQDCLGTYSNTITNIFSVVDFQVQTGKDRKPAAQVKIRVDNRELSGEGEGVGPVDAIINSLKDALPDSLDFALAGYKVDIRSKGTDAVVYVDMKLKKNGVVSLGQGTSPDIIQASVEAFEQAYNGFYR